MISFAMVLWKDLFRNEWIIEETVSLCKLSIPMVLSLFLEYLMPFMSLLFIGHLPQGNISLAYSSAGLGSTFVNMTGIAITDGLCSAADTLCSQAYGYKSYKRVGVILQRGFLIVMLGVFPAWALSLNTEAVLLYLQQPPCVAKYAAQYALIFNLSLPAFVIYSLLRYYLQAQGIVWQLVWIGLLANVATLSLHIIFIFIMNQGYLGAVWAITLSQVVLVVIVLIYMNIRHQNPVTWEGWGFECLFEWRQYIHLAVPGLVLLFLDWFTMEFINLIAGWLGEKELAANTIIIQTTFMLSMLSIGISTAVSVRVGNTLGDGNPVGAKRIAYVSMGIGVVVGALYVVLMQCMKNELADFYMAGDDEVTKKVEKIVPATTGFMFFEQIQLILCGVLHGCGKQNVGAIVIFVSDYIIGLPLGMLLVQKMSMGIEGMWLGMLIGTMLELVVLCRILQTIDWNEVSEEAIRKIEEDILSSDPDIRGMGLHRNGGDKELDHESGLNSTLEHKTLGLQNGGVLVDLKTDRSLLPSGKHYSLSGILRFRLGRCIGLYAVGVIIVIVGYLIHLLIKSSPRTNLSCEM